MASSEGLASVDPWSFRQNFNIDSWLIYDSFSHDSDLLAKALHRSISTSTESSPLSPSSFFDSSTTAVLVSDLSPPQTLSNVSFGSDLEISAVGGALGGAKRKRGPGAAIGSQIWALFQLLLVRFIIISQVLLQRRRTLVVVVVAPPWNWIVTRASQHLNHGKLCDRS
ncbi:unnamed protein product [Arabidopsis arenosa]|uniref:Uncharacterized protein n=1 Tax=Arabidopsis arenosa TaxID=38785 RepID=A0A8S2AR05_ARAAE|nr:unnamed protein product [Arabidopsis arenosa]